MDSMNIILLLILLLLGCGGGYFLHRYVCTKRLGDARELAGRIVEEARKEAQAQKKEILLQGQNDLFNQKRELESEFKERERELKARDRKPSETMATASRMHRASALKSGLRRQPKKSTNCC